MKNRAKPILLIISVILAIVILGYFIDLETVIDLMCSADISLIIFSAVFMIIGYLLASSRLCFILGKKISLRQTFYGDSLGYMATPFIPLPTPVLRAVGLERTTSLSASSLSPAIAVEYLLGMVMRVLALIFVFVLLPSTTDSAWSLILSILSVMVLFGGLIWLVKHPDRAFSAIAHWLSKLPRVNEDNVRHTLADVRAGIQAAGSTRSLIVSLLYSFLIMFSFVLYYYLVWEALPLDLAWSQMLALSMAVLAVVPPTAPLMFNAYQGAVVGALILLRLVDANILMAYAILVQAMQIIFWAIVGLWALTHAKIHLGDLIRRPGKIEGKQ